jgi:hydroxyacylglutathione hydrolase
MINIFPVRVFKDNYIWIVHNQQVALIIDPGDAAPVLAWVNQQKLQPLAIFAPITIAIIPVASLR